MEGDGESQGRRGTKIEREGKRERREGTKEKKNGGEGRFERSNKNTKEGRGKKKKHVKEKTNHKRRTTRGKKRKEKAREWERGERKKTNNDRERKLFYHRMLPDVRKVASGSLHANENTESITRGEQKRQNESCDCGESVTLSVIISLLCLFLLSFCLSVSLSLSFPHILASTTLPHSFPCLPPCITFLCLPFLLFTFHLTSQPPYLSTSPLYLLELLPSCLPRLPYLAHFHTLPLARLPRRLSTLRFDRDELRSASSVRAEWVSYFIVMWWVKYV